MTRRQFYPQSHSLPNRLIAPISYRTKPEMAFHEEIYTRAGLSADERILSKNEYLFNIHVISIFLGHQLPGSRRALTIPIPLPSVARILPNHSLVPQSSRLHHLFGSKFALIMWSLPLAWLVII